MNLKIGYGRLARLERESQQLRTINNILTVYFDTGDWHQAITELLGGTLTQTESDYGFAGVVVDGPKLRILAHLGIVWNPKINRQLYETAMETYRNVGYLEFENFNNLFGQVITTGRAVLSNHPGRDARSGGLPPGYPPLKNFLGVPVPRGNAVVGMIGVANRPRGYTEVQQGTLGMLSQTAAILFDTYRRQQQETALQEQLRQSQKMEAIGRFAGGIAHDFNNLLTIISGYTVLVRQKLEGGENDKSAADSLDEIRQASDRAAALTRQLLTFGQRQVLQPKILDLNGLLFGTARMLTRLLGERVDQRTFLASGLGLIEADPSQLEQVIVNLAINARDAMPDGGQLLFKTANLDLEKGLAGGRAIPAGRYVTLSVSDTGCGMDSQVQSHIFEPFFTTKEPGRGTGLGMAVVYGIVKRSGGYIFVDSKVGVGTEVTIYFPRIERTEGIQDEVEPAVVPETPTGCETILLVEDEEAVRRLTSQILFKSGYAVIEAGDGSEAVSVCKNHRSEIHVVVTDVIMPGLTGPEAVQQLRLIHPDIKVVYISGYTEGFDLKEELRNPHVAFLYKPFHPSRLLQQIRCLLDGLPCHD